MNLEPLAFMSYARADDDHDSKRISRFCQLLAAEISAQTGKHFHIFQDTADIKPGEQWQQRLDDQIDISTFLIPIITPRFFESQACAKEIKRFVSHEQQLGRDDLIIPIYYLTADAIENPNSQYLSNEQQQIAKELTARQFINWRDNRFIDFDTPSARAKFANLAEQIIHVIKRQPQSIASQFTPASVNTTTQAKTSTTNKATDKQANELVVDCYHQGDFVTISEAIEAAKPGTVILVKEGYYPESLTITKPIKIIGQGDVENIVIESNDYNALYFETNVGLVQNLSLRNNKEGYSCVWICAGQLTLEYCNITSSMNSGILILSKANPKISNNQIHSCNRNGIYITEQSQAIIENNEIYNNNYPAIHIDKKGTNPQIRHNKIYSCGNGITIGDEAKAVIEHNDIHNNQFPNIVIKEQANPTIKHNKIHHSKQNGIYIFDEGKGIIEHNNIYANEGKAIEITKDSSPNIGENEIEGD